MIIKTKKITVNEYMKKFIEANEYIVKNIDSFEVDLFFPESFLATKHYEKKAKNQIKERCELVLKLQSHYKEGVKIFDLDTMTVGVGYKSIESKGARKFLSFVLSNEYFDSESQLLIQCGFCDWQDTFHDRDCALGVDLKNNKINLYEDRWSYYNCFDEEKPKNPQIIFADKDKDYKGYESVFLDVPTGKLLLGGNPMLHDLIPRDEDIYWDWEKGAIGMDFFYTIKGLHDFLKWFTENKTYYYFPGACYSNVYANKDKSIFAITDSCKAMRKLPNSDLNREIQSDHSLFFIDSDEAKRLKVDTNPNFVIKGNPGKWEIRYFKSLFESEYGGNFVIIPAK